MEGICDYCKNKYKVRHIEEYKRNKTHYCSKNCINKARHNIFIENFNKYNKDTWIIINYIDKNNIILQCKKCNNVYTYTSRALTQKHLNCQNCKSIKLNKKYQLNSLRLKLIKAEKEKIKAEQEELTILENRLIKSINRIKRKEQAKEKEKARKKIYELKREHRIKNNGNIDKDITLEKLYIRDKGICYICGDKCNYDDYKRTKEGFFIVGLRYPTIDHIIPLNKGGTHTWNNIKLACHICNSKKSDRLL